MAQCSCLCLRKHASNYSMQGWAEEAVSTCSPFPATERSFQHHSETRQYPFLIWKNWLVRSEQTDQTCSLVIRMLQMSMQPYPTTSRLNILQAKETNITSTMNTSATTTTTNMKKTEAATATIMNKYFDKTQEFGKRRSQHKLGTPTTRGPHATTRANIKSTKLPSQPAVQKGLQQKAKRRGIRVVKKENR